MKKMVLAVTLAMAMGVASVGAVAMRLDSTDIPSNQGALILPSKKGQQVVKQPTLALETLHPDVLITTDQPLNMQVVQPASTSERLMVAVKNLLLKAWEFVTLE